MAKVDLGKLGRRVRDLRKASNLTQETLAERAGISWHFVSSIERGQKGATVETLADIAEAVGVSLSELFLGVDHPVPRELSRLQTALAGRTADEQKVVLAIVEQALRLSR